MFVLPYHFNNFQYIDPYSLHPTLDPKLIFQIHKLMYYMKVKI